MVKFLDDIYDKVVAKGIDGRTKTIKRIQWECNHCYQHFETLGYVPKECPYCHSNTIVEVVSRDIPISSKDYLRMNTNQVCPYCHLFFHDEGELPRHLYVNHLDLVERKDPEKARRLIFDYSYPANQRPDTDPEWEIEYSRLRGLVVELLYVIDYELRDDTYRSRKVARSLYDNVSNLLTELDSDIALLRGRGLTSVGQKYSFHETEYLKCLKKNKKHLSENAAGVAGVGEQYLAGDRAKMKPLGDIVEKLEGYQGRSSAGIKHYNDRKGKIESKIADLETQRHLAEINREDKSVLDAIDTKINLTKNNIDKIVNRLDILNDDQNRTQERLDVEKSKYSALAANSTHEKKVMEFIHGKVNEGHSPERALHEASVEYEFDDKEKDKFRDYAELKREKWEQKDKDTKWEWIPGISGKRAKGRAENTKEIDSLAHLLGKKEEELTDLNNKFDASNDPDAREMIDEDRKVVEKEISEITEEIKIVSDHPNRSYRSLVKANKKWNSARAKVGGPTRRVLSAPGKGARWAGGAIKDGWSKHKERMISGFQMLLTIVVFVVLLMYSLRNPDIFPINTSQVIIFIVMALLCGAIKSSLADDKDGEAEAKEVVTLIVLFGTLLAISIQFTWVSMIFCVIMAIYIFFDFVTDSLVFSIVMFILMWFVIWLTMAGWMDIIGIETEKVAVQTGFYEAIHTTFTALSEGIKDVFFMISDPYGWQAQQQMEQNAAKGDGETDSALEIRNVRVSPSAVYASDDIMVMVEVENLGKEDTTRPAKDALIYLQRITNYDDNTDDVNFVEDESADRENKYVGDILSGTGAQEGFDLVAPDDCSGTFRFKAGVHYGYDVDAMGNVFIIDDDRYRELTRQDQFVPEKQVTKSTSGPVSVSLKTNLPQPIPVTPCADPAGEGCKEFSIYFGIMNTRSSNGDASVKDVEIVLPSDFKPMPGQTTDGDGYNCKLCVHPNPTQIVGTDKTVYTIKTLYGTAGDDEREDDPATCDGTSVLADDYLIIKGDMKIFKCNMYYAGTEVDYFKKPLDYNVHIEYDYNSTKAVSFSVRKIMDDEGLENRKCGN